MTFALAFARSDYALIAADTRQRLVQFDDDGTKRVLDSRDDALKLRPLADAWCVWPAMHKWPLRVHPRLEALKAVSPAAIQATLRTAAAELMPEFDRADPHVARSERDHGTLLVIGVLPQTGFYRIGLTWDGVDAFGGLSPDAVAAAGPTEIPMATQQAALATYRAAVDRGPLPAVLRATAQLIHEIALAGGPAGAVSDFLNIGVLRRSSAGNVIGHVLPGMACAVVMESVDPVSLLIEVA